MLHIALGRLKIGSSYVALAQDCRVLIGFEVSAPGKCERDENDACDCFVKMVKPTLQTWRTGWPRTRLLHRRHANSKTKQETKSIYIYIYIHICIYIYIYICMHIIYVHTYTHIYICRPKTQDTFPIEISMS